MAITPIWFALAAGQGVTEADGVLLDLGFSSRQVDRAGYGMSFQSDEPLDMRYDAGQPLDAAEVVNTFSEGELADLFRRYGEEPRAGAVARAIVRERAAHPVRTTGALAALAERAVGLAGERAAGPPDSSRDPDFPGFADRGERGIG